VTHSASHKPKRGINTGQKMNKDNLYTGTSNKLLTNSAAGHRFYSSLDLLRVFWQVPMAPEDKNKTNYVQKQDLHI
jgi:hypothetical protein